MKLKLWRKNTQTKIFESTTQRIEIVFSNDEIHLFSYNYCFEIVSFFRFEIHLEIDKSRTEEQKNW